MSRLGEWIRRKRFATAGHVGVLEARLGEITAMLSNLEQSAIDTRSAINDTRSAIDDTRTKVAEIERTAADAREAASYSRRALELGATGQGAQPLGAEHHRKDSEEWFQAHYWDAADQVLSFLAASELGIGGRDVADIGSGDGIIDLALATRGAPSQLVGFDVNPTSVDGLQRVAATAGIDELPSNLSFAQSGVDSIPAPDESFDVVISWSVFEHVSEPLKMLNEIRRIMRPTGTLMLQLWPFYYSDHGGHLWLTHGGGFPHLMSPDDELMSSLKDKTGTDARRPADDEFLSLNHLTLNELGDLMLTAGLKTARAELISEAVTIPSEIEDVALTDLLVSGVKLLAVRAS